MAAATAVFETYELLESIIAYLPPRRIRMAGNVGRSWHQIVKRSACIRKARCIAPKSPSPLSHFVSLDDYDEDDPNNIDIPLYDRSFAMALHPLLRFREDLATQHAGWFDLEQRFVAFEIPSTLGEQEDGSAEYVTKPPCYMVFLKMMNAENDDDGEAFCYGIECVVRVKEGVRLSDIVKVANAMLEIGRRYNPGGPQHAAVRGGFWVTTPQ
ncbi:hypothetical protein LTR85_009521 [Meristemomyces frigidus]|nr:hypothetical protein LTR85_009521 [Meristemomyces frigidus]